MCVCVCVRSYSQSLMRVGVPAGNWSPPNQRMRLMSSATSQGWMVSAPDTRPVMVLETLISLQLSPSPAGGAGGRGGTPGRADLGGASCQGGSRCCGLKTWGSWSRGAAIPPCWMSTHMLCCACHACSAMWSYAVQCASGLSWFPCRRGSRLCQPGGCDGMVPSGCACA